MDYSTRKLGGVAVRALDKLKLTHNPRTFKNASEALAHCLRYCRHFENGCAIDCAIRKFWKIPPHGPNYEQMMKMTLENKLLEKLAELEHEQWAHLINYIDKRNDDVRWARWRLLASTKYWGLTEEQKESDREWARKVLAIVNEELGKVTDKIREEFNVAKIDRFESARKYTRIHCLEWVLGLLVEEGEKRK